MRAGGGGSVARRSAALHLGSQVGRGGFGGLLADPSHPKLLQALNREALLRVRGDIRAEETKVSFIAKKCGQQFGL